MVNKTSRKRVANKRPGKLTYMQRFGLFFYDRREMTFLYALALIVLGVLSYTTLMQRQGFPAVDVPVSVINGVYFVDDKQKVDAEVTKPIADIVSAMPVVDTVSTQAGDNTYSVVIQYREGTLSADGNDQVRREILDANILPESAQSDFRPINATKYANEYDLLISVYPETGQSVRQLEAKALDVSKALDSREFVARVEVLEQFESGEDPGGAAVIQQTSFDRIGVRDQNSVDFYQSVTVGVTGQTNGDAVKLSEEVNEVLRQLNDQPEFDGYEVVVSADFAENVIEQINDLQRSLLEGLAVVLLICFLLISWRASLTAALSMLTVVLATIAILFVTGNTLNTITLFALILSLGLIVDDTIIKIDAIDAAKTESRRKRDIVALAAKRVSLASVAGTATTMLAFAPMLFIGGTLGDFIRIMPVTVIIGLSVSLLISLALVPLFASGIILRKKPRKGLNPITKFESYISGGLANLILVSKRSRLKGSLIGLGALTIAAVMVVASVPYFSKLKFDIFPTSKDSNGLRASINFPPQTDLSEAQEITNDINQRFKTVLGDNLQRVAYQSSGSESEATATLDLVHYEDRQVTSHQLIDELENEFVGYNRAKVQINQIDVGPPKDELPFRTQVYSEDATRSTRLANDIAAFLQGRQLERTDGSRAKVTRAEIANPAQVTRVDGRRVVEVRAGFDAEDTSALVGLAQAAVEQEFTGPKVASYGLESDALKFDFGSESQNQESFSSLLLAFPFLLIGMYLLMALQFKSLLQPLLIFMAIPFSFFGVAAGLYLTDNSLSFFVMIGFLALIGIAVNNTILLTDYANQARRDGSGRVESIAYAIKVRFRALVATSLTSVAALVPLALSDPFWESLSLTLIFGLLSSTFLVIVAFPYMYLGGEVLKVLGNKLWARQLPAYVQYPLDVVIAPIRLLAFVLHIIFRHKFV